VPGVLLVGEGSGRLYSVFVEQSSFLAALEACAFTRRLWSLFFNTLWPRFYERLVKVLDVAGSRRYCRLEHPALQPDLQG